MSKVVDRTGEVVTLRELCEIMRVTKRTVYNGRSEGHPLYSKGFKMGHRVYYYRADIEAFIAEHAGRRGLERRG